MTMKNVKPNAAQVKARQDLVAVLRLNDQLPPDELLAVVAYFVGQLLALQDERKISSDQAMDLIKRNIEAGNHDAIKQLAATPAPIFKMPK